MRRREYIVGGASLAALVAGGAYVSLGGDSNTPETVSPVTVNTFSASGSPAGTLTVPDPDAVTVIEIFEPFCRGCLDQFPEMVAAHETVGDRATFVSLVPESAGFSPETIVSEFEEHGGNWAVGIDPKDYFFYETFHANSVPHVAVVDRTGVLRFSKSAVVSAETIVETVREALRA